jgi:hypothetical protein
LRENLNLTVKIGIENKKYYSFIQFTESLPKGVEEIVSSQTLFSEMDVHVYDDNERLVFVEEQIKK